MKKVITSIVFIAMMLVNCSGTVPVIDSAAESEAGCIETVDFRDALPPLEIEDPSAPTTFMTAAPRKLVDKSEEKSLAEELTSAPKEKAVNTVTVEPAPETEVEKAAPLEASESETAVEPKEPVSSRYADIIHMISESDIMLMAAAVYQEANNQCFEGQQAVAETILNRMLSGQFPNTISDVLYQRYNGQYQFSTAPLLASTKPNQTNIDAVMAALYGTPVLDAVNVVFFGRAPENNSIAAVIGAHYFCRAYSWG